MRTSQDPSDAGGGAVQPDREAVLSALEAVRDPKTGRGLVAAGLVRGLALRPGRAGFMLEVRAEDVECYGPVRAAAEEALAQVKGVRTAQVVLTTLDPAPPGGARSFAVRPSGPSPERTPVAGEGGAPSSPPGAAPAKNPARPAHVRRIIAVASGKGGVGKSTVAVNLACAFARLGLRTGLLDADVYGPSVPRLLGLAGEPKIGPDKRLLPFHAHGISAASIGLLVPEGAPMIWRGPMASSALGQLLFDVAWGAEDAPLDLLVVDMPPGTGDVQLTLAQRITLDGAVIVSTPQEIALIDVRRGAAMFQKTATPLLGVVENMAYFKDPGSGAEIEIFGRGGARRVAEELGAPFLGEIPIDMALRTGSDAGRPASACAPQSEAAERFLEMAAVLASRLEETDLARRPPRILIEE